MPSSCCSKQLLRGVSTNKLCFRMTSSSLLSSLPRVKDVLGAGWMLLGLHHKVSFESGTGKNGCIHHAEKLWFHFSSGNNNLLILMLNLPLPPSINPVYQVQYGVKSMGPIQHQENF